MIRSRATTATRSQNSGRLAAADTSCASSTSRRQVVDAHHEKRTSPAASAKSAPSAAGPPSARVSPGRASLSRSAAARTSSGSSVPGRSVARLRRPARQRKSTASSICGRPARRVASVENASWTSAGIIGSLCQVNPSGHAPDEVSRATGVTVKRCSEAARFHRCHHYPKQPRIGLPPPAFAEHREAMTELRARALKSLTATALLAATLYACSSTTGGFGNDSNGNGSSSGSTGDDAAGGNAGGDACPGMGTGPARDDSGAGGADGATTEPADATVGPHADASSPRDSGASPLDSSPGTSTDASSDESAWLDPQNAARMATMANEPALTWNPILAEVALAYAKQCVWAHNPNLQADYRSAGGTTSAGENIAAGAPTLTIASANSGWIDEKSIYDYATNTCT